MLFLLCILTDHRCCLSLILTFVWWTDRLCFSLPAFTTHVTVFAPILCFSEIVFSELCPQVQVFQSNLNLNNISDQALKSKWHEQSQDKTKLWSSERKPHANQQIEFTFSRAFPSLHCCAWPCQDLPVVNSSYNARKTEPNTVWNSARSEYRLRPSRVLPECEQLSVVISCSILEALYWCYLTSHFLSPLLFSPPWLSALLWLLSPVPLCIKARMFLYYFTGLLCAPAAVGVVKCF